MTCVLICTGYFKKEIDKLEKRNFLFMIYVAALLF